LLERDAEIFVSLIARDLRLVHTQTSRELTLGDALRNARGNEQVSLHLPRKVTSSAVNSITAAFIHARPGAVDAVTSSSDVLCCDALVGEATKASCRPCSGIRAMDRIDANNYFDRLRAEHFQVP